MLLGSEGKGIQGKRQRILLSYRPAIMRRSGPYGDYIQPRGVAEAGLTMLRTIDGSKAT
jgi:hypothetical protein